MEKRGKPTASASPVSPSRGKPARTGEGKICWARSTAPWSATPPARQDDACAELVEHVLLFELALEEAEHLVQPLFEDVSDELTRDMAL